MKRHLFAVLLMCSPVWASDAWVTDPAASRLQFIVSYEGQETVGEFRRFDVNLNFNPDAPDSAVLEVLVDITSADMDSEDLNTEILKPDWFAAGQFPKARFFSDTIRSDGGNRFIASGTLDLKGVSKAIEVPFSWSADGGQTRLGGALELQRTDFDIGNGEWASGDTIATGVKVRFQLSLVRRVDATGE